MRKLVHLSDLHFGRTSDAVVAALRQVIGRLDPHLIAVSGDLTQRARKREFVAARQFLDSLAAPKVVVPGNHDVPLYNVIARFLTPLDRYRMHLSDDVEPSYVDDEIAVVGVNTARSLTFKRGRINREQVKRVAGVFCDDDTGSRVRVLVTHHPFDLPEAHDDTELVGRAGMAMSRLRECAPDVLLAGHLHHHSIGTTAERYDLGGHSAIVVQAGTATSTRVRATANSFNLLHIDRHAVAIERFDWSPDASSFATAAHVRFVRRGREWVPVDGAG